MSYLLGAVRAVVELVHHSAVVELARLECHVVEQLELARLSVVVELARLGAVVWSQVATHFRTFAPHGAGPTDPFAATDAAAGSTDQSPSPLI